MIYEKYGTYDVEFSKDEGSIQSGIRPVVIIQNDLGNKYSPTVLVIPLTSQVKKVNLATHVVIDNDVDNGLTKTSMLLGEQVTVVNKTAIKRKRGKIGNRELQRKIFRCFINASAYGSDDEDAKEIIY